MSDKNKLRVQQFMVDHIQHLPVGSLAKRVGDAVLVVEGSFGAFARAIGVTPATVYAIVYKGAMPRQKVQQRIDQYFAKLGQRGMSGD